MSQDLIKLKGITWDHSRGFTSIVAASQRFYELNPNVEISWHKRSLQDFADKHIGDLAAAFDLLIIDHPWAGFVSVHETLLPLDEYLNPEFLKDQARNSVGKSHESYTYAGHQWGLAIDAATPVASSRPDLLEKHNLQLPKTWDDLLNMADRGCVIIPAIPIDTLMNFYMFCDAAGEEPFQRKDEVVSEETGIKALRIMRSLAQKVDPECFDLNPIRVYERMTLADKYAYCPFAYGYSNYARRGYAKHVLHFHDIVAYKGKKLRSTIGGTGLSVSRICKHPEVAAKFAEYALSPEVQRTLFFDAGGQPGYRAAWTDEYTNSLTNNYFKNTLPTMDRGILRPRYNGYMHFQDHGGDPIRKFMMEGGNEGAVLSELNKLYKESQK